MITTEERRGGGVDERQGQFRSRKKVEKARKMRMEGEKMKMKTKRSLCLKIVKVPVRRPLISNQ